MLFTCGQFLMQLCPLGRHFTPAPSLSLLPLFVPNGDPGGTPGVIKGLIRLPEACKALPFLQHSSSLSWQQGELTQRSFPAPDAPKAPSSSVFDLSYQTGFWNVTPVDSGVQQAPPPVSPRAPQSVTSFNPAISLEKYREAGTQVMMGAANGLMRMNHVTSQTSIRSTPYYQHRQEGGSFNM